MEKEMIILKALAHPLRLEIIKLLSDKQCLCVCKIQDYFDATQSNLSQHLKILKDAEILVSKKEGGWVYYSLKNHNLLDILNILKNS
ncbi:MAG: ArsR/SmtB family transcription factor [Cetobacterium sp.]|uniref:ArsR/SmtB family transcription factor n=1 Tax=Cetobacterium sp. TaxID=2071632 RepID=UPI003F3FD303